MSFPTAVYEQVHYYFYSYQERMRRVHLICYIIRNFQEYMCHRLPWNTFLTHRQALITGLHLVMRLLLRFLCFLSDR